MPELPEVQVVINYLKANVLNQKISNVIVNLTKIIKNKTVNEFIGFFKNHCFVDILRRGKYLIFKLDNGKCFVSHLRMEGKYFYQPKPYSFQKHDHIIFEMNDNYLIYNDSRQFGTMTLYDSYNQAINSIEIKKLGYEPFSEDFTVDNLFNLTKKSNKAIKTFLLDQTNIAGIGNIYADEILFKAKIHPESITKHLNKNQIQLIVENTKAILEDSIKHNGTTIHTFKFNNWSTGDYQAYLLVHTKKNQKCICCQSLIKKIEVNGRGTYYCEKCQIKY